MLDLLRYFRWYLHDFVNACDMHACRTLDREKQPFGWLGFFPVEIFNDEDDNDGDDDVDDVDDDGDDDDDGNGDGDDDGDNR